jgi:hypothetical membrane protein
MGFHIDFSLSTALIIFGILLLIIGVSLLTQTIIAGGSALLSVGVLALITAGIYYWYTRPSGESSVYKYY